MSAFSTISALRRRRPEGLPEGNAAAGGACRGWLAGSGLQGAPCWGGASQGAPCRERLAGGGASQGGASQGALADRHPVRGMFPLLALRSDPLRPACTSEMPRRLRTPATTQPHNHATSQPRNLTTPQPRNHAATQPPQPLSHAKRALPAWGEPFCIGMASCAYPRNESRIPAATAEPTTPATLGPMACISR